MSAPKRCHNGCRNCDAAQTASNSQFFKCTGCDDGFMPDTTDTFKCTPCGDGCKLCGTTSCTTCKTGYKASTTDTKKCLLIQCYPSCKECDRSGTVATVDSLYYYPCKTCLTGHYLDGTQCKPCMKGCGKCSVANQCDSDGCKTGYTYLTASQTCSQLTCHPNCVDCLSTKVSDATLPFYVCNKCGPGTYSAAVGNYECKNCIQNCLECSSATSTMCDKCVLGYTQNSDKTKCVQLQCSSTCKNCDRNQLMPIPTDPKYFGCKDCRDGYFLKPAPSLECAACPSNCKTCSDANTCTACNDGYITNADSKCVEIPCDSSCKTCDRTKPMPTAATATYFACQSCPEGTYLDDTTTFKCIACQPNCKKCNATTCQACAAGYTFNQADNRCEQVQCSSTCKVCDRTLPMPSAASTKYYGCQSCPDGTLLDATTTKQCLSCIPNCKACSDYTTCSTCFDGYTYDATAKMCLEIPCSSTCHTCDRTKLSGTPPVYGCKACPPKQFIDANAGSKCSSCMANCSVCSAGNTCTTCDDGFSLNNDNSACLPKKCDPTCGTCLTTEVNIVGSAALYTCQTCPTGTYASTKYACSSCKANCKVCSNGNSCTTCNTGYTYDTVNKVCLPTVCSSTCNYCSPTSAVAVGLVAYSSCVVCPAQTYHNANGYECSPCMAGCDTCKDSVSCNACSAGYSLVNNQCVVGGSGARLLLEANEVSAISNENSQTNTLGGVLGGVIGFSAIVTLGLLARYFFKKTGSNNQKKVQEQQTATSQ